MRFTYKEGEQDGIQIGIQQGIQTGIQQGIQTGIQQGIQTGIQQGIQTGIQQGIFAMIRDNLEENVPSERIIQKLQKHFHLTQEDAQAWMVRLQTLEDE